MSAVCEAVLLIAGEGSRLRQGFRLRRSYGGQASGQANLRGLDETFLKPFVLVLGRPLISYTLDALTRTGIKTVHFVVGYEGERMIEQRRQIIPSGVNASFGENRTGSRFLPPPVMSAHLFSSR